LPDGFAIERAITDICQMGEQFQIVDEGASACLPPLMPKPSTAPAPLGRYFCARS
jgi:hypothetical protein